MRGEGRRFKPGQTGNPNGSSKKSQERARLNGLTTTEVIEIGSELLRASYHELDAASTDTTQGNLRMWMAGVIKKGINDNEAQTLMLILSRLVGKPTETKQLTGIDGGPIEVMGSEMTDEEKAARAEQLRAMRQAVSEQQ